MTDDTTLDDLPQPEYDGTVAPDDLYVDGDNPNEQDEETFGLLCDRMRDNGWLGGAIITDTDGCIADGEHRWRAAQEIGLAEVPVKQYAIDDATRRLWRQELNKIAGEHDPKRDALEYDYLLDAGKSDEVHDLVDAADEDLDELLAEIKVDSSMPPAYEYDPEHNVHFEDCVEGMRERLDDDSVDCVITDPPWGIEFDSNFSDRFEEIENDDNLDWLRPFAAEMSRVLSPHGHAYVFTSWEYIGEFISAFENAGLEVPNHLIWTKPKSRATGGNGAWRAHHENILWVRNTGDGPPPRRIPTDDNWTVREGYKSTLGDVSDPNSMDHPNQKPVSLIADFVTKSTEPGDTVCDPFMGSGTTAVAAIQNDRDYVGFEVDAENYRDEIERRIGEAKRQVDAGVNTDA